MLAEVLTQKLWTCTRCYLLCVTISARQERLRDFSLRTGILSHSPHHPLFPPCLRFLKQRCSSVLKWMSCASGLLKFSWVPTESWKFLFYEVGPTEVLWQGELNSKIFFGWSLHITVFYCNGLTGFWYILLFLQPEKLVINSCLCRLVHKRGSFVGIWFLKEGKTKAKPPLDKFVELLLCWSCSCYTFAAVAGGCSGRWGLFLWGREGTWTCLEGVLLMSRNDSKESFWCPGLPGTGATVSWWSQREC